MATLWLEYGQDFALNANGGLLMAQQFDETRQALCRTAFTVPAGAQYPNGSPVTPDYLAAPDFGLGLALKIGANVTSKSEHDIRRALVAAAASLPGVDPSQPATVTIFDDPAHTLNATVFVPLLSGAVTPVQVQV